MRKLRLEPGDICLSCIDLIGANCTNVDHEKAVTHLCNWCGNIKPTLPSEHFWIVVDDADDQSLVSFSI